MEKRILDINIYDGMLECGKNRWYPFVSCDEMTFLSVMIYYKKNILPMMIKMNFLYKLEKESGQLIFGADNPNLDSKYNLLSDIGIKKVINKSQNTDGLKHIKKCIWNKHPAQFMIDLFYQRGRDYYYNNVHGGHYVLAYGFDDYEGEIHLIDNVAGYDKYIIKYIDFDKLRGIEQNGEIWEYVNEYDIDTYAREFEAKALEMYKVGISEQMEERGQSIELINKLIDQYNEFMLQTDFCNHINGVTYNRISELCRMRYISKYMLYSTISQKKIENYLQEIIADWKKVNLYVKYRNARRQKEEEYIEEKKILASIIKNEHALNKILVTELL